MKVLTLALLLLFAQDAPKRGQVTSRADRGQDFSTIRTYAWARPMR